MAGFAWLLALAAMWVGRMQLEAHSRCQQPGAHVYVQLPLSKAAGLRPMPTEYQDSGSEEELIHAALELTQQGRDSEQEELILPKTRPIRFVQA